ncbi:MAG: WXG100 family type VII secretion target [Catenulisporales bacterium]|jgi:WXG100 family type VII secretion target|nr:WXG100 family type VII secretion target [Catenulisporales bacterium]
MTNMNVTYQDMRDAGHQLQNYETGIQDQLKQAQALVKNLVAGGFVTDQASKAFDEKYAEFTNGATQMIDGMTGMVQYLNSAADALEHTDSSLAQAIRH